MLQKKNKPSPLNIKTQTKYNIKLVEVEDNQVMHQETKRDQCQFLTKDRLRIAECSRVIHQENKHVKCQFVRDKKVVIAGLMHFNAAGHAWDSETTSVKHKARDIGFLLRGNSTQSELSY